MPQKRHGNMRDSHVYDGMEAEEIAKLFFVTLVGAAGVVPRMPFDSVWSTGGRLSRSFRYLLLVIVLFNVVRKCFLPILVRDVSLALFAVECIMTSFLSLLVPYLLRFWLSDMINFPGREQSGKGLTKWLFIVVALTWVGVILRCINDQDDWWIFKKVADAITFVPVVQTILLYNKATTSGAPHPGRGTALSQVALVIEWYCLLVHCADIAVRLLKVAGVGDWTDRAVSVAMYSHNNHYAVFIRIFIHSILMNTIDEGSAVVRMHGDDDENGGGAEEVEELSALVVV